MPHRPHDSSQPTPTPAELAATHRPRSRRHAAVWAVAALLALAGCASNEPPGRRSHQRRR